MLEHDILGQTNIGDISGKQFWSIPVSPAMIPMLQLINIVRLPLRHDVIYTFNTVRLPRWHDIFDTFNIIRLLRRDDVIDTLSCWQLYLQTDGKRATGLKRFCPDDFCHAKFVKTTDATFRFGRQFTVWTWCYDTTERRPDDTETSVYILWTAVTSWTENRFWSQRNTHERHAVSSAIMSHM